MSVSGLVWFLSISVSYEHPKVKLKGYGNCGECGSGREQKFGETTIRDLRRIRKNKQMLSRMFNSVCIGFYNSVIYRL